MTVSTLRPVVKPSYAELQARLEYLEAHQPKPRAISFKVGEKGGVSAYGMGRFPVTLYVEQWERLFAAIPELKAFIVANESKLTRKAA